MSNEKRRSKAHAPPAVPEGFIEQERERKRKAAEDIIANKRARPSYRGKNTNKMIPSVGGVSDEEAVQGKHVKKNTLWPTRLLTNQVKKEMIQALAARFHYGEVCHAHGISYQSFLVERNKDPEFAAAIEEAYEKYTALITGTIHDRAIVGIVEPVFGPLGPGQGSGVIGHKRVFDNKLLNSMAKVYSKKWREALGRPEDAAVQTQAPALNLSALSPEAQAELRALLEREQARKASGGAV